jgi:hypothetical protein
LVDADALTEGPTDMNDPTNGTQAPPPTLSDAIQAHAQALLKANAMPNGMMAINPAQLYCDLELAQVRIEVLFEAGSAALCQASARRLVVQNRNGAAAWRVLLGHRTIIPELSLGL